LIAVGATGAPTARVSNSSTRVRVRLCAWRRKAIRFTSPQTGTLRKNLFAAKDQTELVRRDHLTLHLDAAHRGLGTASCGPDTLPRYRITPGRYTLAYRLRLDRELTR